MKNEDREVMRSGAYFKDPGNMQPLTGKEPRVIECRLTEDGKFVWPQIRFSNGTVGKIVYSLYTAEEKAIYKQYRSKGIKREKPVVKQAIVKESINDKEVDTVQQYHEPNYDDSVASMTTLAYIKNCDTHVGVLILDGHIYDNITAKGSRQCMPVPRSLIPKEDRERLNIPV